MLEDPDHELQYREQVRQFKIVHLISPVSSFSLMGSVVLDSILR